MKKASKGNWKKYTNKRHIFSLAALIILGSASVSLWSSVSPRSIPSPLEAKFTDASPKGLAIVPASGASNPCSNPPTPTADNGGYNLSANQTGVYINSGSLQFCTNNTGTYDYFIPQKTAAELQSFHTASINLAGVEINPYNSIAAPTMAMTADSQNISVGQTIGIHATFTPASGDSITNTAINVIPPAGYNAGNEYIGITSGVFYITQLEDPITYTFTPTVPGNYIFLPYVTSTQYPTWTTTASTQWLTVTVN
jgi:hypothetical protein